MSTYGGALQPFIVTLGPVADPTTNVEFAFFRATGPCQVVAVRAVNDATIATTTDTLQVLVTKWPVGVVANTVNVADFPAATGWTLDVPRDGTLSTTAANLKLVAGDYLAYKHVEAGTGGETRMVVQVELVAGHQS
jgi:hypothetical protein